MAELCWVQAAVFRAERCGRAAAERRPVRGPVGMGRSRPGPTSSSQGVYLAGFCVGHGAFQGLEVSSNMASGRTRRDAASAKESIGKIQRVLTSLHMEQLRAGPGERHGAPPAHGPPAARLALSGLVTCHA